MVRHLIAASGAVAALVAIPLAPAAAADDSRVLLLDEGQVRCQVSADDVARGGGPMVVCQRTDGLPFAQSSWSAEKYSERLPVAVKEGTGEFYWAKGSVPDTPDATVLNTGQTIHLYGWTIEAERLRTRIAYDSSGHGIYIAKEDINQF